MPLWHYLLMSTWHELNRDRLREYQRKYRRQHPEKAKTYRDRDYAKHGDRRRAAMRAQYSTKRSNWLMRSYGVTEEWYAETLLSQGGRCAICRSDTPGGPHKVFSVDHDHATGQVRGLLCKDCNHMLGMAKDRIDTLQAAIEYLQKSRERV